MRRNAESLLVLAGIDAGRRLRDAMPLSDVVRTASSEIEQYDRVELDLQADPHMHGFNALAPPTCSPSCSRTRRFLRAGDAASSPRRRSALGACGSPSPTSAWA